MQLEIIIPCYNEEKVIAVLADHLNKVFSPEMCEKYKTAVSFILIDDGSKDKTVELVLSHFDTQHNTKLICFSRNFGHQSAVSAGLTYANADWVAIIDADLQDPPEVVWQMMEKAQMGYDVVYGVRRRRKEGILKRFGYWTFYRIYHYLSPIDVPIDSGDFCVMSRRVVKAINLLPENLRFVRGLRSWVGYKQIGHEYERSARVAGTSKYNFSRLYKLATDGITAMSVQPLKVIQHSATLFLIVFLVAAFILLFRISTITNWEIYALWLTMLLSNGVILLALHLICAYIGRMYLEIKGRPNFVIREIISRAEE
jgi:dolichol-phosphate mannosyltransferase